MSHERLQLLQDSQRGFRFPPIYNSNVNAICACCGAVSKNVHQNHFHPVTDLSIMNGPVTLMVNRRQFKCHVCGQPFSEVLDFVDKRNPVVRFTVTFPQRRLRSANPVFCQHIFARLKLGQARRRS